MDKLQCRPLRQTHIQVANLDHHVDGLPLKCKCGEVDFTEDIAAYSQDESKRWVTLSQAPSGTLGLRE